MSNESKTWLDDYIPAPNCAVCSWFFCVSMDGTPRCKAQGSIDTRIVYGNNLCMKLFKEDDPWEDTEDEGESE